MQMSPVPWPVGTANRFKRHCRAVKLYKIPKARRMSSLAKHVDTPTNIFMELRPRQKGFADEMKGNLGSGGACLLAID
ncbi:hypothetical protein SDC9_122196 [bioreactor metagenome]|uniref:Uncharacterized protein n=1 Tax=bioreactor metagenome TaxID=1076179 RepID=A0A645CE76_9ZZZZ